MKTSQAKTTTRAEWAGLIVYLAIILGTFMRFSPTLTAGFTVGDGGMFAVMVNDLKASGYWLPAFTTYNHANIPFAYPPLGFYAGRIASDLFRLTAAETLRWVPAFFASLSIPAFYLLASRLLKKKYHAGVSTLFFAFMPRALSWFVLGGGLTRSPGQFFMLLTLATAVRLYREPRRGDVFLAGLLAGLTILSHPEAAVHMVAGMIFLWVMLGHSRAAFLNLVGVGVMALILSAPWWATVIYYHGVAPLASALQTGQKTLSVLNLVFFDFTEELYATLIAVLGLVGLGYRLIRRDFLLPLWLTIPFLVEGRSAALPAAIPLAMLAAIGLIDVVLAAFLSSPGREMSASERVTPVELGVFAYLLIYLLFSTYQFGLQLSASTLSLPDREAMAWVRQNTAPNSTFLVLTGTNSITCDWVAEWFPALTGRRSLYTVQGQEWVKGEQFVSYVRSAYAPHKCLTDGDLSCLDSVVDRSQYDYLYVDKFPHWDCRTLEQKNTFYYFLESVGRDPQFGTVYESERVVIFKK